MGLRIWVALAIAAVLGAGCSKKRRAADDAGIAATGSGSAFRTPDGGIDRAAIAAELDRRCVAGELESCRNLAILYQSGAGVTADPRRAAALFAQACNGGNLSSCNHLALALSEGMGIAADAPKAAELYQKACDGGYALACRNLGMMLRDGHGIPVDLARAGELLDRACTANAPFACTNAGNLDATLVAKEGAPRRKKMLDHFTRGCEAGDPTSCRQVGVLYLDGFALPKSHAAAAVWLKKACDRDDAIACRVLGLLHRDGAGVPRDPALSARLLTRACERKDDEACKLGGGAAGSAAGPGSAAPAVDAGAPNGSGVPSSGTRRGPP